jgi:carbonic anhydrase/acetyltransferase-like protein (isoleucine patch superfamily)
VKPEELYATAMEGEFNNWLAKFDSLEALFASRHQLHARLTKQQDGSIEDHSLIIGPVHVSSTSRVLAGAIIRGPAIIGPDVTIHHGAKVLDGSFIGAGSRVGPGRRVSKHSNEWLNHLRELCHTERGRGCRRVYRRRCSKSEDKAKAFASHKTSIHLSGPS